MNPAKIIHAFYRRFNTSASAKDRAKSYQSLCHLLRIIIKDSKRIEWLDEFAGDNLLWQPSAGLIALKTLSPDQKLAIIEDVSAPTPVKNKTKKQRVRRQYKAKIKKTILVEQAKGNDLAVSLLEIVLKTANDKRVEEWILDVFKRLEMSRKDQRVKMLETYIEAHNSLKDCLPNANNVFLQEGIFKIPHRWDITTDIVNTESYITVVKDFLTEHFPDYPIKLIAAHHDERMFEKESSDFRDTGAHSHYILSGKNSKTDASDLNNAQIKVVNDYIKRVGPEAHYLPDDGKISWTQSIIFGHYFQRLFYDFFNQNLLEPKGLKADFAEETVETNEQNRRRDKQSKGPISQRDYNLNNALSEESAQRQQVLKEQNAKLLVEKNVLINEIQAKNQELGDKNSQIKGKYRQIVDLTQNKKEVHEEIQELQAEMTDLRAVNESLVQDYGQHLTTLIKDVYVRLNYSERGLNKQAHQYLLKIVERFNTHIPAELQQHCISAAQSVGDTELEALLLENVEVSHDELS